MLLERTVFGREAMNVIACEAAERIERPETYKQWQVRNMRAGFEQLPLEKEIMRIARNRVKSSYHKDFVIDEDGHWLLQGWKGELYMHFLLGGQLIEGHEERPDHQLLAMQSEYELLLRG
ncbi:UNVERIFIED_CONTAM: Scarecrow-like protein 9 [Sesamum radiatum]|uniref:Scarecrow-like protein 9 n=1 Tax=Sesamum radiatum TaxID=300843 RepID=A0AAW2TEG4_SESRA